MQHFQRFRIMFGLGRNGETFRRSWMRPTLRCSGFSGGLHSPAFPRQPQPGICCSLAPGRCLGLWYRGQQEVVSTFRFHYERAHFKSWGCPPRKKTFFGAQITPPSRSHVAQARPKGSRLNNFLIVKKVANQNQFGQWGTPLHANLGNLCRSKKSVKVNVCKGVPPFWERPKRKGFFSRRASHRRFQNSLNKINKIPFPRVAKETAPNCSVRPSLTLEFVAHLTLSLT